MGEIIAQMVAVAAGIQGASCLSLACAVPEEYADRLEDRGQMLCDNADFILFGLLDEASP